MENATVTVNVTIQKQVNPMDYPFRKDKCHAFAMLNDKECLFVTHAELLRPSISLAHSGLPFTSEDTKDCTREEFFKLYNETLLRVQGIAFHIAELEPA